MKKIRVLQVNKLYAPVTGGVERVVQQIAEGLREKTEMTVLVCQKKGASTEEKINGVTVHRASSLGVAFSTPLSLSFFLKFHRLVRENDIVHIHMPFPLADIAAMLSGYTGKIVVWWHSDIVKQKKLLVLYKPFMLWLLRRADCIMVATEGHINGSNFLPPFRAKCVIIPFGVDYTLLAQSKNALTKPSLPKNRCCILFVGRLVYYKGCNVLIDAFSKIHGAHLRIIGTGPLEQSLRMQVHTLGLDDRITFEGLVSEGTLAQAFKECDFFVLPSVERTEAFGLVQIEAMAYGKPVINTNLPSGVPYVSLNGVTGLTVEPNDVNALSYAMQKLVDNSTLREKFSHAAYHRARDMFSMEVMLNRIFQEYQNLV